MFALFDDDYIYDSALKSERRIAREEGRAEGEASGEARGRAEGEARGEARGMIKSIKNLMTSTKKSMTEAMALLGIPQSEYAKYEELAKQAK